MDPLLIGAYVFAILFEIGMPIALALFIRWRWGVPWRYFFYGALIFFLFQLITRVPAVQLIQLALADQLQQSEAFQWGWLFVLALTAGLFEEIGRYLGYRYLVFGKSRSEVSDQLSAFSHQPSAVSDQLLELRTQNSEHRTSDSPLTVWKKGVMYGLGHGGLESILLVGGLVLLSFINALVLTRMDPSTIAALPPDQAEQVRQAQAIFENLPWWTPLLGAVERLFTVIVQIAFSILVLQAFVRNSLMWLYLAIAAHFLVDLIAVSSVRFVGAVGAEVVIGVFALAALYLIFRLKPKPAT
ncbi:MAG: YhfC family intramembrane metalloprotease [Chloroflexota bacterium]|jgi:uncharacterized membrane protein YhfC